MHRGYIKLYRAIWDTDLWDDKPYSKLRAWIDILMLANHKEGQFEVRGHVIKVDRGQLGRSKKKLGARWKWSEKKVETFLKRLKKEHQIEYQTNNVTTLITITNYEKYQGEEDQKEAQKKRKRSAEDAQKKTNKNVKNVNNEKKTYIEHFPETFKSSVKFVETWTNWITFRGELKKPMTETAAKQQAVMLSKLSVVQAIETIEKSIQNSWQGLFPPKETDGPLVRDDFSEREDMQ